jgi:hypothetical protein
LNSGFVILSVRVDGFFFGDAFGVRVRRLILQLFEQLADAELSGEDLRARLGDLGRGAEFLAAAVMFSRGIRAFGEFRVAGFAPGRRARADVLFAQPGVDEGDHRSREWTIVVRRRDRVGTAHLAPFHPSMSYASIMESCWRITLIWLAMRFLACANCGGGDERCEIGQRWRIARQRTANRRSLAPEEVCRSGRAFCGG